MLFIFYFIGVIVAYFQVGKVFIPAQDFNGWSNLIFKIYVSLVTYWLFLLPRDWLVKIGEFLENYLGPIDK